MVSISAKALSVSHAEASPHEGIQVDATSDDIAAGFGVTDLSAVRKRQVVENLGFDEREVVAAGSVVVRGEGPRLSGVTISVQPLPGQRAHLSNCAHWTSRLFSQRDHLDLATQLGQRRAGRGEGGVERGQDIAKTHR